MTLYLSNPRAKSRWTALSILVTIGFVIAMLVPMAALAAPPKISLEQCRNGSAAAPNDCVGTLGGGSGWVGGNAGATQAHFVEGHSIPYRAIVTDIPTNQAITVTLGYDIKHSGVHAIDFLTHYDRLQPHGQFSHPTQEQVLPQSGTSVNDPTPAECAIPKPSNLSAAAGASFDAIVGQSKHLFTVFGASSCSVATPQTVVGDVNASQSEARIEVTFIADSTDVVLAWGGHIARSNDWNQQGAAQISGSPYHMRLKAWTLGSVGNQDRSLSAAAVLSEASQTTTVLHERTTVAGTTDVSPANNGLAIAVPLGSFVNDVILVSPNTATGTATFRYYSTVEACTADTAGSAGTAAGVNIGVTGGTATSSTLSTTTLGVGTYYFRAFFTGTAGEFDDSISPCDEILYVFDPLTQLEIKDQLTGLPTGAVGSVVYRAYANADGPTALAACTADVQSAANPFGTGGTSLSPTAQAVAGATAPASTNALTLAPGNSAYFKAFFVGSGGTTPTTHFETACSKETATVGQ